jgi:hypothetical protein
MSLRMKFSLVAVAVVLSGLGLRQADAALLAPGASALAPAEPGPVGATLLATITSPFANAFYSGSVTTQVLSNDASNPLGGFTFTYQVAINAGSPGGIERINGINYTGFVTDVSYLPGSGTGQVPTSVDRGPTGLQVGFNFVPPPLGLGTLQPGTTSPLLVVQTNAFAFVPSMVNIIDGTVTAVNSFGPSDSGIPEPASLGVLAIGATALIRRRAH